MVVVGRFAVAVMVTVAVGVADGDGCCGGSVVGVGHVS